MAEWLDMDEERYEAALADAGGATFYHSRAWARIVTASFPAVEDHSALLRTRSGLHAVPLFCWKRAAGLLRTLHSSFPFLYGGPIPSTPEAWAAVAERLSSGSASARLMGNPFTPGAPGVRARNGGPEDSPDRTSTASRSAGDADDDGDDGDTAASSASRSAGGDDDTAASSASKGAGDGTVPPRSLPWPRSLHQHAETTHLLDLPDSTDTYWEKRLTTQKRNDIRRLTRKGVTVETTTADDDVRQVYDFYQRRMASWSQRPGIIYPLRLYQEMMSTGGEAVRLYAARFEGRLIGGTFVCRAHGVVHYHAGYFDDEAKRLRPNVLVQERIIRDAIEEGFRRYDFLPSAGIASVEKFKESFGGVRARFPYWIRLGWPHRLAGRIRSTT